MQNGKITVEICSGTACYVMGASEILLLEESLPDDLKGRVSIEGATCMEYCRNSANGKPPFVKVNGELLESASVVSVIEKIQSLTGN